MRRIPCGLASLSLVLFLEGCSSTRSEYWLRDARLELAPPMPEPFLPAPRDGRFQAKLGYSKSFESKGRFYPDEVSGAFPMESDSNLYWGSLGFEHSTSRDDPARIAFRITRWNSVWCGEVGVLVDFGEYSFLGSMGLELVQANHSIDDSLAIYDNSLLDGSTLLYSRGRRFSDVENRLALAPSMSIAKTVGPFQPWAAGVMEYRSSKPEASERPDPSGPSDVKIVHSSWGGYAQVMGGIRCRLTSSLFLSISAGGVVAGGDYELSSPKTSFSLTFTR